MGDRRPSSINSAQSNDTAKLNRAAHFKDKVHKVLGRTDRSRASSIVSQAGMVRFATTQQRRSLIFQDRGVREAMMKRQKMKIIILVDDLTPKNLGTIDMEDLEDLELPIGGTSIWGMSAERRSRLFAGPMVTSSEAAPSSNSRFSLQHSITTTDIDGIVNQITNASLTDAIHDIVDATMSMSAASQAQSSESKPSVATTTSSASGLHDETAAHISQQFPPPLPQFIKINVRETDDIPLYSANSVTVPKDGGDEARRVEEDNQLYDYLTIGKGRARRTSEAEAQTAMILYKSRSVNTDRVRHQNVGSYVSNFDMFDTYAELERSTHTLDAEGGAEGQIAVTTYTGSGVGENAEERLGRNDNFKLSSMVLQRLLAGNNFRNRQKRFRNMIMPDPLDLGIRYLYRLDELWTYQLSGLIGCAVSCLSWCQTNGDLLAIGYGVYDFQTSSARKNGFVAVWSIKNPRNPERLYRYTVPVTAVAFSRANPQLLAVGLYDGTIEVLDISDDSPMRVACSERNSSPGLEPVWQIEWIHVDFAEELLTCAEDGLVMKYSLTNGPNLVGFRQIRLDRVEGQVEGLTVPKRPISQLDADRHSQALMLQIHPVKKDIFYVGTDEGCLHKCSTFFPHQYAGIMQVHQGGVGNMQFSPWSPKLFMTCGSDWKVRLWIDEIYEPVLELCSGFEPIHCAYWSPIHSTVVVCLSKQSVELWNIRKNVIRPASVTQFYAGNTALTTCAFSPCGRSLIVGDADGATHVCALEDMPFPPHFQYMELQSAIYAALVTKPELMRQVKSLGYLGYPGGERMPN